MDARDEAHHCLGSSHLLQNVSDDCGSCLKSWGQPVVQEPADYGLEPRDFAGNMDGEEETVDGDDNGDGIDIEGEEKTKPN